MKRKSDHILQFKIVLKSIKPPIWRRIQVPAVYTFRDFHVAIQDAMGWTDSHLHEFNVSDPIYDARVRIGIPDEEFPERKTLPEEEQTIAAWFTQENSSADYLYDFGDDWEHEVRMEKIMAVEPDVRYPRCTAGRRACPPEDCGGVVGYERILEILSDAHHMEYAEMLEWVGEDFDPERFEPKGALFSDSATRLKLTPEEC